MEQTETVAGTTLFVKYVPEPVTEVDLVMDFSQYGTVLKAVLYTGRFAYVEFSERVEALYAMAIMDRAYYHGSNLCIVLAAPRKRIRANFIEYPVTVTNVPQHVAKHKIYHALVLKDITVVHKIQFRGQNDNKGTKVWRIICTEAGFAKPIETALQDVVGCDKIRVKTEKPQYCSIKKPKVEEYENSV